MAKITVECLRKIFTQLCIGEISEEKGVELLNEKASEPEWIPISEINNNESLEGESILIWQHNLSDPESSRFQRAVWYKESHIDVYPLTHKTRFKFKDGNYDGYDLEGDMCRVTHFKTINRPLDATTQ